MRILQDRWKGVRGLPHVQLANLPTPVLPLRGMSEQLGAEIWCKREELCAERYGGNKLRKLEYLLGDAMRRGCDTVLTWGRVGSHHVLATTVHARALGIATHAYLCPQRRSLHVEEGLRATIAAGAQLGVLRRPEESGIRLAAAKGVLTLRGRKVFPIPMGGTSALGSLGWVEAGLELARQIDAGLCPEPDEVLLPLGSGGTIAGLAVGLAAAGLTCRVTGLRVIPGRASRRRMLLEQVDDIVALLRRQDERFPAVQANVAECLRVEEAHWFRDGRLPRAMERRAKELLRDQEEVPMDPSYTLPCVAALAARSGSELKGKRVLYIHTLNGRSLANLVAACPRIPLRLQRLLLP